MEATGRRIKALRAANGLSVQRLRQMLQIESVQTVYKWERGDAVPSIDNLILLSRIFGCSMESILVVREDSGHTQ